MTIERRVVVGLDDIKAVSLECVKCQFRMTMPASDIKEIPNHCQKCGHVWLPPSPPKEHGWMEPTFARFVESFVAVRGLVTQNALGVRILFEFEEPNG